MLVGRAQTCSWPPLTSVLNRYDFKAWPDDPRWVLHAFSSIPLVGYDIPEADLTIDFLFAYLTLHHIYIYMKKHTCIYIYINIYICMCTLHMGICLYVSEWQVFSQHSGHLAAFGWTKCQPRRMDWKFTHGAGGGWHVENNTMGGCEDENQTNK